MKQAAAPQSEWASSNALGLFAFGFTTLLLQFHNLGMIKATTPLAFGFVWGGAAQVIAGIIAGKRNDMFHLTAFTSYGVFWIGLALCLTVFSKDVDTAGLGWTMVIWGIFTFLMMFATLKDNFVAFFVFLSLTILFFLLTFHFLNNLDAKVAGVEGLFCGAAAVYGGAAGVINDKFGRTVLPLGKFGGSSSAVKSPAGAK